jgi:ribosome maturation factor RimP
MERPLLADAASTEDPIRETVEPVVTGLGYTLVDLQSKFVRDRLRVNIVIYSAQGVTVDDCAEVHQAVMPRIEVLQDSRDVYLEVSSPGIDRNFRTNHEFSVFQGRGVKILRADTDEWIGGIIAKVDDNEVQVRNESGTVTVAMDVVRKARLDESQEVTE